MIPTDAIGAVRQRIAAACARAGRDADSVRLIGASKTVEAARLAQYFGAGLTDLGENYIQEAIAKVRYFEEHDLKANWHFIGALQSNKAREAVAHFDLIHSLDRISLAKSLDKEAAKINKIQRVLIQVNLEEETSKGGVSPGELGNLYRQVGSMDSLRVEGLMSLPPYREDSAQMREYHRQLCALAQGLELKELSMGMSGDYEVAIEQGATQIRVGTLLFGARR